MVPTEIESSKLSSFIVPAVQESTPEVVVVYFESDLQTYEVASLNSKDSVFSYIQQQLASHKNSVSVPFVKVDSLLPLDLLHEFNSAVAFHSGVSSLFAHVPTIASLEELKDHPMLSNNKQPDLLIVDLSHEADTLRAKFARSREVVAAIEQLLANVRHISIYTGQANDAQLQKTFARKRSVEGEAEYQAGNVSDAMATIQPMAPFNYWTPGWFWEVGTIVIIIFGTAAFGIYQLFAIPVTYKLATPKKQKIL